MLIACLCPAAGRINIDFIDGRVVAPCNIMVNGSVVLSNIVIDLGADYEIILHSDFARAYNLSQSEEIVLQFQSGSSITVDSFFESDISSLNVLNYYNGNIESVPFWAIIGLAAFSDFELVQLDIQKKELLFSNDLSVGSDTFEIELGKDRYGYYADFEPVSDYRLKAVISTACYESVFDDVCADIADMPQSGFESCLLGGFNIAPYNAFKVKGYSSNDRDLIVGNNLWQYFKVTFNVSGLKIILENKPDLKPDLLLKQYYGLCKSKDYEKMRLFLKAHPQASFVRSEIYNLLLFYLSSDDVADSTINSFTETLFEIFPADIAVEIILGQIEKAKAPKYNTRTVVNFLVAVRNIINTCNDQTVRKYIVEARLGDMLTVSGNPELGYEYLISALYNQPDNSEINFLVGRYYYRQKLLVRAWYSLLRASLAHKPKAGALQLLNQLYNSPEFRSSFDLVDTRDLLASKDMHFSAALTKMNWHERCNGILEYFVFSDDFELRELLRALDAIERYCPEAGLLTVSYFIDQPAVSPFSSEYGNMLAERYLASGRPAIYLNGKSYGFSSQTISSADSIVDNLYSVKDRFNLVKADIFVQLQQSGKFDLSVSLPDSLQYSSCEFLLVENNVLFLSDGKLRLLNNLCRIAVDRMGFVGRQIHKQYSFDHLQQSYNNRIAEQGKDAPGVYAWKSTVLDPRQSYILAKFYDANGKIIAVGRAKFQIAGGEDGQ